MFMEVLMNKYILLLIAAISLLPISQVVGQSSEITPAPHNTSPDTSINQGALLEAILVLERIDAKLERLAPHHTEKKDEEFGFGGGPFIPIRFFTGMATLNTHLGTMGNYATFADTWYPFANGMGGTWRFGSHKNLHFGMQSWGGGMVRLGQRNASQFPQGAIDEDSDGLDDYYSYASYGISMLDFLVHYRIPIDKVGTTLAFGAVVGAGSDGFAINHNQRGFLNNTGLSAIISENGWSRSLLNLGGYVTFQIQPHAEARWFKIGFNGGYNHPIPLSDWSPNAGIHIKELSPPIDFSPAHIWASLSFDFNF
jgi:hypothetical protein